MRIAFLAVTAVATSCGLDPGDPHSVAFVPPPAGTDSTIAEIADPESESKAPHKTPVVVSGAVVVAVDTYDETKQGNSAGTIYVNDLGSNDMQPGDRAYSGLSLFNPSFIPGNLRVGVGDTLDLRGEFQENQDIPLTFAPGAFLVQIASPIATYRFEAKVPDPVDIDINDLAEYSTGRKWLNMIVRVRNVKLGRDAFFLDENNRPNSGRSGRVSSPLLEVQNDKTNCEDPFPKAPTLVNELFDIVPLELKEGTELKELVGLVTFFCNLHIAPRSAADIVR